jgi:hypothetical protein
VVLGSSLAFRETTLSVLLILGKRGPAKFCGRVASDPPQSYVGPSSRVWLVVEAAVGEGAAEAFVKEEKE